jgi:hypothetical protein
VRMSPLVSSSISVMPSNVLDSWLSRTFAGCGGNGISRSNDVGAKPLLRKIIWVQRHNEICISRLCADTKRFIPRIGREVAAGWDRHFSPSG